MVGWLLPRKAGWPVKFTLRWGLEFRDHILLMFYRLCCFFEQVQFSSVAQSCPTLCDPMNSSMPGLPVHHHLLEFTQTHIHQVGDAIQPSHPLLAPFPPAPNPSQHQSLFQWVNSSREVAKVLKFSFSIIPSKEHPEWGEKIDLCSSLFFPSVIENIIQCD